MKKYIYIFGFFLIGSDINSSLLERETRALEKSRKSLSKHVVKSKEELYDLLAKKDQRDIVVINDISESYEDFEIVTPKESFRTPVVTIELLKSIFEQQIVLCSKSLIINIYFYVGLWMNFLNLEPKILQKKYDFLNEFSIPRIEQIKSSIMELQRLSEKYKKEVNVSNQADLDLEISNQIELDLEIREVVQKSDIDEKLLFCWFMFKEYYQQLVKILPEYDFYEVNQMYLLLYPKNIKPIDFSLFKKIEANDLLKSLKYEKDLDINILFIHAIKSVIKTNIDEKSKDTISDEEFFRWNIFMIGHGEMDEIVGVSDITFQEILKYFNQNYLVNTLTILSCFSGGKKLKDFFGHELYSEVNPLLKNIKFPILFFGSFFSPVVNSALIKSWMIYKKNFLKKDYDYFFKEIRTKRFFSALDLFSSYDKQGVFTNYGAIKFPNVNWVTVSDYKKNVFNITKTLVVANYSKNMIKVPELKNIILLNTNTIPLDLTIDMTHCGRCKILPIFYTDQNYAIKYLRLNGVKVLPVDREKEIAEKLWNLFDLKLVNLAEPITIFIEKASMGRYQISNILIELDKNLITFESLNIPGRVIKAQIESNELKIQKIFPEINYLQKVSDIGKKLEKSEGFLSGVNPNFIKKLETKIKAQSFSQLNPKAKEFISKVHLK